MNSELIGPWRPSSLARLRASALSAVGTLPLARRGISVYDVLRYSDWVIRSFRDSTTERLWSRQRVKTIDPRIERTALRKLVMLDAAETLDDLRVPPGNRLEALRGDRIGQHSIRINQQWRICFTWTDAGPSDVEIVDYH